MESNAGIARAAWTRWRSRARACLAVGATLLAATAQAVPLEVYGRLPTREFMTLSPDGTRIAYVQPLDDGRAVVTLSLDDGKPIDVVKLGKQKIRDLAWADDAHLMIRSSQTATPRGWWGEDSEWFALEVHDIVKHSSTNIPDIHHVHSLALMNAIAGEVNVRVIDGHVVLFVAGYQIGERRMHRVLLRADLATGEERIAGFSPNDNDQTWLVDARGKIVAQESYDEAGKHWTIAVDIPGQGMKPVDSGEAAIDRPYLVGFGGDTRTALVEDPRGGWHWRSLSMTDGSYAPPPDGLAADEQPLRDRFGLRMIGGVVEHDDRARFKDAVLQAHWQAIREELAASRVHLASWSDDFRKIVFKVDGPDGYAYYLMDTKKDELAKLGDIYEGLRAPLEVRRVDYAAADGMKLEAFLTLPRGREARMLPLVVLPHGGPAAHDTADFDWWSQALAEQGYAVLRTNFRGSDLDAALEEAGHGEWGRKMQSDLSDGVRQLAKQGLVDPARACIIGASYGGYAALAGVTLESGVYRCAVSVAGPSDLSQLLKWVDTRHRSQDNLDHRSWDRIIGVTGADDPLLPAISPARHVDRVAVPILLIHGEDDTVVPFEQSRIMFDALRAAHKDVTLVKLDDEDHWLSSSATRLRMLQAVVGFLRTNNPPDDAAAAGRHAQ